MPRHRISAPSRRQQILDVATGLFSRQGFKGTTTRQIADRAGVTEALIFRHFPHKQELYWAVIDRKCRMRGGKQRLGQTLRDGRGETEVLADIAEDLLRRNSEDATLSRLLLFSALEEHSLSHRFFRTHVAERYEMLADYIRRRIRAGEFRRVDPLLAARGFLGMVVYHFLIQELFGGKQRRRYHPRAVSETLAAIWLQGMKARNGRHTPRIQRISSARIPKLRDGAGHHPARHRTS